MAEQNIENAQNFDESGASVEVYEFADFENDAPQLDIDVSDYKIRDLREYREAVQEKIQPIIKKERVHMEGSQFVVSPVVDHHRGLKDQAIREKEDRFQKELEEKLNQVRQEAYNEGFSKGKEDGFQSMQDDLHATALEKIQNLENYIDEIHNERLELLKREKINIYELVKTLTKWIILRELEDDGAYLERLLEKLILEMQSKSNLLLKVDKEYFESMPEICDLIEQRVGTLTNTRVEILQRTEEDKEKGLIVECDNGIIDSRMETQFEILEKLFENLDVYDS